MSSKPDDRESGPFFALLRGLEKVIWPISIASGVAGMIGGFYVGGVGGAIVGAPVGFICGFLLVYSLPLIMVAGATILALILAVGAVGFLIWLIYSLWGVGKP